MDDIILKNVFLKNKPEKPANRCVASYRLNGTAATKWNWYGLLVYYMATSWLSSFRYRRICLRFL